MNLISTSIPINTWINAPWAEFLQCADDPTQAKSKGYYYHRRMRFEPMSTGSDHSKDHILVIMAIGLYAMVRQIPLNSHDACSYRQPGQTEFQPDISCYTAANVNAIPPGTRVIDLNTYPLPNLVIEISDTTLSDDKGEKRLQYEELGIAEYWIVNVQTCEIIAFAISATGSSQRIRVSQVLAELALDLLESALQRSRQESQSTTIAWFMQQINS